MSVPVFIYPNTKSPNRVAAIIVTAEIYEYVEAEFLAVKV